MDRELIQSWLQLPPGNWPPDHYTLLGLKPGEGDAVRIEQQVHERMQRLRSYQLTHPELASQAMNTIAQALVCLTDPNAKSAYDRQLFGKHAVEEQPAPPAVTVAANEPAPASVSTVSPVGSKGAPPTPEELKVFDWQTEPPPPRGLQPFTLPPSLEIMSKETVSNLILPIPGPGDTFPEVPPVPPLESEAPSAEEELRGRFSRLKLRSKGALYFEIARTRQLLWAWEQTGAYLSRPTRLVSRPAEATDLIHHMGVIRELLPSMTPLMGEAGQPGYLVLALARQQMIVPTLQTLLPSQREALARDWQAGHSLLRKIRLFLRQQLHVVRRKRGWRHGLRLLGATIRDHPGVVLFLGAIIAVNIAWSKIQYLWPQQMICLLAVAAIWLAWWHYSLQPLRMHSVSLPEKKLRSDRKVAGRRRQPDSSRV
ncbi:MAG TPA: hypothetical protein VKU02_27380 [Gemmataceae bacterium]|nr:hypothetical protein [Gemmataceae bacterium]